jgi:hypothetical protein
MPYDLKEKDRVRVAGMDRNRRVDHLFEKAANVGELWTLAQGESVLVLEGEEDGPFAPLWPHPDYVPDWAEGAFGDDPPPNVDIVAIPTGDLRDDLLSAFESDGVSLLLFPTAEDDGEMTKAAALRQRLGA